MAYYTTVEACNGAGLCVSVTSDGIVADTSPPEAGVIFHGIDVADRKYQSSRYIYVETRMKIAIKTLYCANCPIVVDVL